MQYEIKQMLFESASLKTVMAENFAHHIEKFGKIVIDCFKKGNKILVCGNGGSAADAQHFASEFVARYKKNRRALPAIALTTDTSVLTCWSNDIGYDTVFSRQVEAFGKEGDVLVIITTSGNSKNLIEALKKAKEMKIKTIALLGKGGGLIKGLADLEIIVPSDETPRIQEAQMSVMHIVCELVEQDMFGKKSI